MKQWIATARALVAVLGLATSALAEAASAVERAQPYEAAPKEGQANKKLSDAQIRRLLIDESIAAYSGNCPCPYSTMRNGRTCGRRSAYSREGGEAPLCYSKDVTAEMVQAYRDANAEE